MHEGLAMNATTGGRSVICLSALLCAEGHRPAPAATGQHRGSVEGEI